MTALLACGEILALTSTRAANEAGLAERISGLFVLEERLPREPADHVPETCWVVSRREDAGEGPTWTVAEWDLFREADPHAYGELVREERASELADEDEERLGRAAVSRAIVARYADGMVGDERHETEEDER